MKPTVRLPDETTVTWGDVVAVTSNGGRRLGKDAHDLLVIPC